MDTNLTYWQQWQLEQYGNILPEPATIFVVIGENEVPEMSQAEANYIYAIENPKQ